MTVVDTLVFGVLAIGLILGLIRGLLSQVTGLVGLVGGLYLAWRYHDGMQSAVIDPLFTTDHNDKIAFGVILLACLLITALFGWLLGLLFDKMSLGAYDRLMGGLFGVVKSGLICAGIMLAVVVLAHDNGDIERAIGSSKSGPWIWSALDKAAAILPKDVRGDVRGFLAENSLPAPEAPRSEPETPPVGIVSPPESGE